MGFFNEKYKSKRHAKFILLLRKVTSFFIGRSGSVHGIITTYDPGKETLYSINYSKKKK